MEEFQEVGDTLPKAFNTVGFMASHGLMSHKARENRRIILLIPMLAIFMVCFRLLFIEGQHQSCTLQSSLFDDFITDEQIVGTFSKEVMYCSSLFVFG